MKLMHVVLGMLWVTGFFPVQTADAQEMRRWDRYFGDSSFSAKHFTDSILIKLRDGGTDSLALQKLKRLIALPDSAVLRSFNPIQKAPIGNIGRKPFVSLKGGYINYQWNYRSNIDTPFLESNISQHLIAASVDLEVSGVLPLRVTLFQRFSNSDVFRDFTDFRVEFNGYAFQQMQAQRIREYFNRMAGQLRDPLQLAGMNLSRDRFLGLSEWLSAAAIRTQYIQAKEKLLSPDLLENEEGDRDSLLAKASAFVSFYESLQKEKLKYKSQYDSLRQAYETTESRLRNIQKLLKGNLNNPENMSALRKVMSASGLSENQIRKLESPINGIRTLAVGRTLPDYSTLTVRNVNVRGINFEYNQHNLYLAATAGAVDFRIRDFVYSRQKRVPQYLMAGRIGYGLKDGTHLIFTAYRGEKQLYPGVTQSKAFPIYGYSIEAQYLVAKNHRISAEMAQSNANALFKPQSPKPDENFWNRNNRAYAFRLRSYIPSTHTRIDAMYQYQGINFQSFTNFRSNAAFDSWNFRAEQSLFRRQLILVASMQKNDFANPYILQRYNANTVFKTLSATFRRPKWPSVTLGYMPSSQYTMIDSMVYEHRFQAMNSSLTHQFPIGTARSTLVLMVNKFYNNGRDSGFIYYNAVNVFARQQVDFASTLSLNWGISHMNNGQYNYNILEVGTGFRVLSNFTVQGGVKINQIDQVPSKLGFYANTKITIRSLGEINCWLERNYLPGLQQNLVESALYSVGFTRYFTHK
jgi:hypothetical protein